MEQQSLLINYNKKLLGFRKCECKTINFLSVLL